MDERSDDVNVVVFNETQQIVLAILPIISSILSIIGSSCIVYIIISDYKRKLIKPYHRLVLAVSLSDLTSSLSYSTSTFLLPKDDTTPGMYAFAYGNQITCNIQGVLSQIGFSSCFYTASLAIFFYLSTKKGILCTRNSSINQQLHKLTPYMLIIPLLLNIPFAIFGIFLELYNPLEYGIGCWIASKPHGCDDNNDTNDTGVANVSCIRGDNASLYSWIFGGIWIFPIFIIMMFCFGNIYYMVKHQIRTVERYSSEIFRIQTQTTTTTTTTGNATTNNNLNRARQTARQTAIQGMMYMGAFFAVYVWNFIARAMEIYGANPNGMFIISCLSQIFSPSQGTFNFFIFLRPVYLDMKRIHPDDNVWMIWKKIIFDSGNKVVAGVAVAGHHHRHNNRPLSSSPLSSLPSSRQRQRQQRIIPTTTNSGQQHEQQQQQHNNNNDINNNNSSYYYSSSSEGQQQQQRHYHSTTLKSSCCCSSSSIGGDDTMLTMVAHHHHNPTRTMSSNGSNGGIISSINISGCSLDLDPLQATEEEGGIIVDNEKKYDSMGRDFVVDDENEVDVSSSDIITNSLSAATTVTTTFDKEIHRTTTTTTTRRKPPKNSSVVYELSLSSDEESIANDDENDNDDDVDDDNDNDVAISFRDEGREQEEQLFEKSMEFLDGSFFMKSINVSLDLNYCSSDNSETTLHA